MYGDEEGGGCDGSQIRKQGSVGDNKLFGSGLTVKVSSNTVDADRTGNARWVLTLAAWRGVQEGALGHGGTSRTSGRYMETSTMMQASRSTTGEAWHGEYAGVRTSWLMTFSPTANWRFLEGATRVACFAAAATPLRSCRSWRNDAEAAEQAAILWRLALSAWVSMIILLAPRRRVAECCQTRRSVVTWRRRQRYGNAQACISSRRMRKTGRYLSCSAGRQNSGCGAEPMRPQCLARRAGRRRYAMRCWPRNR